MAKRKESASSTRVESHHHATSPMMRPCNDTRPVVAPAKQLYVHATLQTISHGQGSPAANQEVATAFILSVWIFRCIRNNFFNVLLPGKQFYSPSRLNTLIEQKLSEKKNKYNKNVNNQVPSTEFTTSCVPHCESSLPLTHTRPLNNID